MTAPHSFDVAERRDRVIDLRLLVAGQLAVAGDDHDSRNRVSAGEIGESLLYLSGFGTGRQERRLVVRGHLVDTAEGRAAHGSADQPDEDEQ